jgi:hypothetical protein
MYKIATLCTIRISTFGMSIGLRYAALFSSSPADRAIRLPPERFSRGAQIFEG